MMYFMDECALWMYLMCIQVILVYMQLGGIF